MRVITGSARGRKLKALPGRDTRPTTDKVKESIFNIVQFDVEGRRVLDLFAGTGQLGIEALSRGAERCTFVELNRAAAALVRENVDHCGFALRAEVVQSDAAAYLTGCGEKFGLVLLDTPYASPLLERSLELISKIDIVAGNGIIVCESDAERELPQLDAPYEKGREYRYGKIKLTLYNRRA